MSSRYRRDRQPDGRGPQQTGGGLNKSMVWRIVMAWLVTVPVTIATAAGLL
jgi:phosphate/sulfate permease